MNDLAQRDAAEGDAASAASAHSKGLRNKGPWTHRVAFGLFTIAFGVLCFWLVDFVLSDIDTREGPDRRAIEQEMLDEHLVEESEQTNDELDANARAMAQDRQRQQSLRDSTSEAQRTMDQLLDFQRLAIDKGVTPSPQEQQALADSQRLFLENQQQFQQINQRVAELDETRRTLEDQQRSLRRRLDDARRPVEEEYRRLWQRHRWISAAWKLALLLPLLAVAVWLWVKLRGTLYAPMVYAYDAAVALQLALVMHEYFPTRYFRYVLIGAALVGVFRILVLLVRQVARPKSDWLVRQYREAYERFLCPVCEYPIRRGPLKYLYWTRRTARQLPVVHASEAASATDGPYTCPICATKLYEECPSCHGQRHALLPACEHCGATKSVSEITAVAAK